MKRLTTSLISLAAALGIAHAASALGASPSATRSPPNALATQAFGDIYKRTGNVPVGSKDVVISTPYCAVSYAQGVHPISRVSGMGIDNPSDPAADASSPLEDFTSVVGQVDTGALVDISVRGNTAGEFSEGIRLYVDWNQDGIFNEAHEGYLIGYLFNTTGSDGRQVSATIRVPDSARTGETRMRVIKAFDLMAIPRACNEDASGWGQAEDYTLNVGGMESELIFCSSFEDGEDGSCATSPSADIVYSGQLNVVIPPTASGLRVNFVTGETSSTGIPIYHFFANKGDPYLFGPGMMFSWGIEVNNAGVALSNSGPYRVLGPGDTIGPSSTFSRHGYDLPGAMANYWRGMNGYLGVKFLNEETAEVNYGYVHMLTTTGTGFPAMIMDYAYDKSGAAITIP